MSFVGAASTEELSARHRGSFLDRYGRRDAASVRCFYAPGRVNLMGAHLDYNGGPVLPMAIDRGTFVAIRPRGDHAVRLATTSSDETCEFDLRSASSAERDLWSDYPLGVVMGLLEGGVADERPGVDVLFGGNLPVGAGLSSSASICVATAHALNAVWELALTPMQLVETALWAEREFVGVHCGIMDPYAVGLARPGHLLWLDCRDSSWSHLPIESSTAIAVADTGVRRELARGEFNLRVQQCAAAFEKLRVHAPEAICLRDVPLEVLELAGDALDATEGRRARHVLEEVVRTFEARDALESGDLAAFGARMLAAHDSLRDLFEVSVPELDRLVDTARSTPGVHGARLTGAGFGGCTVNVLAKGAEAEFEARLVRDFETTFGRRPAIEFFEGDPGPRETTD